MVDFPLLCYFAKGQQVMRAIICKRIWNAEFQTSSLESMSHVEKYPKGCPSTRVLDRGQNDLTKDHDDSRGQQKTDQATSAKGQEERNCHESILPWVPSSQNLKLQNAKQNLCCLNFYPILVQPVEFVNVNTHLYILKWWHFKILWSHGTRIICEPENPQHETFWKAKGRNRQISQFTRNIQGLKRHHSLSKRVWPNSKA